MQCPFVSTRRISARTDTTTYKRSAAVNSSVKQNTKITTSMTPLHLNTHPDFVTLAELARWGEDHPDLWVQKMSEHIWEISKLSTRYTNSGQTVSEVVEMLEDELRSAENAREYAEQDRDEAELRQERAEETAKALRFDLINNEQHHMIEHLKSRIIDKSKEIDKLNHSLLVTRSHFDELNISHKELQAKYNTWLAIAT